MINFNPPPLPNPEAARSTQPAKAVADDAQPTDVFSQLIAAASRSRAPAATDLSGGVPADGDRARKADEARKADDAGTADERARADLMPADWMLALGAVPLAVPVTPTAEPFRALAVAADDSTARRVAWPAGAVLPERGAHRALELNGAPFATLAAGPDATDAARPAADATLRDQLAAALESRAGSKAPAPQPVALDKDARAADSTLVAATEKPSAAASALAVAASIPAAIETERPVDRSPPAQGSALDATAAAAPAPSPASLRFEAPAIVTIDAPVGAPGFGGELASKVAHVLLRNDRAEVRLSPADLGPVDIRIDLRSDNATLTIVAAHPATRDALEQALPQLREALAAQGIALGQAAVHDGRSQPDRRFGEPDAQPSRAPLPDARSPVLATARVPLSNRLVDTFA